MRPGHVYEMYVRRPAGLADSNPEAVASCYSGNRSGRLCPHGAFAHAGWRRSQRPASPAPPDTGPGPAGANPFRAGLPGMGATGVEALGSG